MYVAGRVIHLLRLADGRDVSLPEPPGSGPVLAQIEEPGLFFAYQVPDADSQGRLGFVPFAALPVRGT